MNLSLLPLLFVFINQFNNFVTSETFCPTIHNPPSDRRENKTNLRIMQYNVEWLFIDYYESAKCPGSGCTWSTQNIAITHANFVSTIIQELQPDIINLCEIEGCDELYTLINSTQNTKYIPYVIQGLDSATGQNVGILTTIDPIINLYRTEERVDYPIPGSTCGYSGEKGNTGVTKHYITEFEFDDIKIVMIGAHLLAFPTDVTRCVEREAQAQVLQNMIIKYYTNKYEIIVLGDFNDFDGEIVDANNNKPISQVLNILKGNKGTYATKYELFNIAEKIPQEERYSDWWDKNGNCNSTLNEFSMIDHILVTPFLQTKIVNYFIYKGYGEFCGTYNSDHYPVVIDLRF